MKLKKENKGFAICNCIITIDEYSVNYVTRYKEYRIQLDEMLYLNWRRSWFIYKNLELHCCMEDITLAII